MTSLLAKKLGEELAKAKSERPALEKDTKESAKILDESTGNTPKPLFFHVSHNSHGDWGKHWAHGGIVEDQSSDKPEDGPVNQPSATNFSS